MVTLHNRKNDVSTFFGKGISLFSHMLDLLRSVTQSLANRARS